MEDLSNYEKLKEAAINFYHNIGKIHSPVLEQDIYFTAEGFNHIIFTNSRSERGACLKFYVSNYFP